MHDFVLDVEVQLPAQELAKVFVNEVVEGVASGVTTQVRLQPGVVGPLAAGGDMRLAQLCNPRGQ
jgi:hypothetical protein